ncbi:MAG: DUF3427 domain-containing protein [Armatimonadetes bacterium]|nr:DUF3427 domain-containing protein [Armatimonadota bacterium]
MGLPLGLYDRVIDRALAEQLAAMPEVLADAAALDPGDSHAALTQHLTGLLRRVLSSLRGQQALADQAALCDLVVELLGELAPLAVDQGDQLSQPPRRLVEVRPRPLLASMTSSAQQRPAGPLAMSSLFTGSRTDPSLISQLQAELASADTVDILCSFVKWTGIRALADSLEQFTAKPKARLRLVTTCYIGATESKAVQFLAALPNTQVKVSYDTAHTRLHAKVYIFHRHSGFGSAYIGSSNLSGAALTEGLEWNLKVSQCETPHLWEKICGTFETQWNDDDFRRYDTAEAPRFEQALRHARSVGRDDPGFMFEIRPWPFQQDILDRLEAERQYHGRFRNLVVAATGTGKTVMAALDYRRYAAAAYQGGKRPRLLFVAHRREILEQSRSCFQAVLRDPNFGDLLVGNQTPQSLDHLFVSIQSYNSGGLAERVAPDFYDYVVVDEFHHAAAASYRLLLERLQPQILLGLTATPERADGLDILGHFDGRIGAELRLPDAINRGLLCPFHYFGVTDVVDLDRARWQRGGYVIEDLDALYTGNQQRADLVIRQVRQKLADVQQARGLGFCVSVKHAEFMAQCFRQAGIPAEALTGDSPHDVRSGVRQRLTNREINFIFTVDLFNEGVDIPEVDTVLFLRPTESLTVFLQQLGRGLRRCEGKDALTVLDFVGQAQRSYNFEARFRALMDQPRVRVDVEIDEGCQHVPLGCLIHLERKAKDYVLANIRHAIANLRRDLVGRIASFGADTGQPPTLARFVDHYHLDPDDLYRGGRGWSRLCCQAGLRDAFEEPDERQLSGGLRRLLHLDSAAHLAALRELVPLSPDQVEQRTQTDRELLRRWTMLHADLWGRWEVPTVRDSAARLSANPTMRAELMELLQLQHERLHHVPPPLALPFQATLELHCHYRRDEILAALGATTVQEARELREGVLYLGDIDTDVLFITLNKTDKGYSPTTLYEDYAVSETLFHWQSQSTTAAEHPTGRRYIDQPQRGSHVLLFVREDKNGEGGRPAPPYVFLGPADYEQHEGSRPMSIIWRLRTPMPAWLVPQAVRMSVA